MLPGRVFVQRNRFSWSHNVKLGMLIDAMGLTPLWDCRGTIRLSVTPAIPRVHTCMLPPSRAQWHMVASRFDKRSGCLLLNFGSAVSHMCPQTCCLGPLCFCKYLPLSFHFYLFILCTSQSAIVWVGFFYELLPFLFWQICTFKLPSIIKIAHFGIWYLLCQYYYW